MKKLLILSALFVALTSATIQVRAQKIYDFVSVSKQPEYPGGMKAFYSYLSNNLKYPEVAKKQKIQGKTFLSFVVEENGALSDVKVIRGLTKETDAEAIRILKSSPKWNPGMLKGKAVRVKYNMAVNFTLA